MINIILEKEREREKKIMKKVNNCFKCNSFTLFWSFSRKWCDVFKNVICINTKSIRINYGTE